MEDDQRRIVLRNGDEGVALFGPNDVFLREIERSASVRIMTRASHIVVTGSDCARIERVLLVLLALIRGGTGIAMSDVVYALHVSRTGDVDQLLSLDAVHLGTSARGRLIKAKTIAQRHYVQLIREKDLVFGIGPAGTGKTYLAIVSAVRALKEGLYKRIVLTRPAIEAGESLGFLPGDLKEKADPYMRPMYDAMADVLGIDAHTKLLERGTVEIAPIAYMRGRTLEECFIVVDEAQNTTSEQMKMCLTRIGMRSRMVVTGDPTQIDLPRGKTSGLIEAIDKLAHIEDIGFVTFDQADIVRHTLVQKIVHAYATH
jgi:phosphate starvation-inducible PhoH-like protein